MLACLLATELSIFVAISYAKALLSPFVCPTVRPSHAAVRQTNDRMVMRFPASGSAETLRIQRVREKHCNLVRVS